MTATAEAPSAALECGPADAEIFRTLWRGFGSSVALVATEYQGQRHAMLATAATSVSMEPPSLLICVNRSASAFAALDARGAFSLGILPSAHQGIGAHIAKSASAQRFERGEWREYASVPGDTTGGLPWLAEAQATLFCETEQTCDYGTHRILVAQVTGAAGCLGDDPLLYCNGRFGRFVEVEA
ncbi:MAG: flavin reductase family protein [Celeribacter sp.]|jgi:flavin reductase (DIM6/NTAB) family NADH-FMN oxidoreductase RutF